MYSSNTWAIQLLPTHQHQALKCSTLLSLVFMCSWSSWSRYSSVPNTPLPAVPKVPESVIQVFPLHPSYKSGIPNTWRPPKLGLQVIQMFPPELGILMFPPLLSLLARCFHHTCAKYEGVHLSQRTRCSQQNWDGYSDVPEQVLLVFSMHLSHVFTFFN